MTNLEEVAAAADAVADEQRAVAETARAMQREREGGASWAAILDRQHVTDVVTRLRHSAQRLRAASTSLMSFLARELTAEGESRRRIAHRLGVSHQRVTSLLHSHGRATAGDE